MSTTVPRYLNRPSALRQRGPRADVCAWRFTKRLPRLLHHHDCTTTPLRYTVSGRPASILPGRAAPDIAEHPHLSIPIAASTDPIGPLRGFLHRVYSTPAGTRGGIHIPAADGRHRINLNGPRQSALRTYRWKAVSGIPLLEAASRQGVLPTHTGHLGDTSPDGQLPRYSSRSLLPVARPRTNIGGISHWA
ncbi:hypothetical protein B0G81_8086 [Paraburkholderia sp. BL6665CI2N2]|nr:hypothetical protein B0G81_8086 [Paraburkholderia sp. BL6665CI2N2]